MNFIKTESFQLAIYSQGNPNSERLALVLPGKLDTKDYAHMKSHVEYLAGLGFFAVSFDPPGTWESPGGIELYTMSNYEKAIHELIAYYGNKPTFLIGHSRGGSLAVIAGAANPNVFAFASIMGSLSTGVFKEEKDAGWKEKGYVISMRDLPPGGEQKLKQFKLPYNYFLDQQKYDLTTNLLHSQKPKLFFLGKQDTLVTPNRIKGAYELYFQPKELYELNSSHDYRHNEKMIAEVNNVVENFLKKYNL